MNKIESNFEEHKICSAAFIDIKQAFDRVWHTGLLFKIKRHLPQYFILFKSYLSDRFFQVTHGNALSEIQIIEAGVPQGSVLGPTLYKIYTADIPCEENVLTATYADDSAVLASHEDPILASQILQESLDKITTWAHKWRIKINESKSTHIVFTTKHKVCPPVQINNITLPTEKQVKYLGMYLDQRLTWKPHLTTKRKQINLKLKKMYWLIGRKSSLLLYNKILLYKTIVIPIWTYGIQLWGCAKTSNINIIQRCQNKTLRTITDAPWYVNNETIHKDLNIKYVHEQIKKYAKSYESRLEHHPNDLALNLLDNANEIRRLKRTKPLDLNN